MSVLDRLIWNALSGPQAGLARWNAAQTAVRIDPAYGPFAATLPGDEAALADLLGSAEDEVWLLTPEAFAAPEGLRITRQAELVQMVAHSTPTADFAGIVALGEGDTRQMAALAEATQPGPWGPKTHLYGQFYGLRDGETLAAMAGERLRPALGWAEVSGVCTDPLYRGRGHAARLIARVMAGLADRGDAAFLHSWAANHGAIALYQRLGFEIRAQMVASVVMRG